MVFPRYLVETAQVAVALQDQQMSLGYCDFHAVRQQLAEYRIVFLGVVLGVAAEIQAEQVYSRYTLEVAHSAGWTSKFFLSILARSPSRSLRS